MTNDYASIVAAADVGGDVAEHGPAGGVAGKQGARLDLARGVEVDLVLEDLADDDRHLVLVVAAYLDQRPGPRVQHDHALLDQRRELEAPPDLVDDLLFLQLIVHGPLP